MMTRILLFLLLAVLPAVAQRGMRSPAFMSSIAEAAPSGTAPDAPTDLTVGSNPWGVSWTDNAINEDGFEVSRSTDGGSFAVVQSVAPDETFWEDSATPGDTHSYAYRVRATNDFGQSSWAGPVYTVWTFNTQGYVPMEEAAGNTRASSTGQGPDYEEVGGTVAQTAGKNNNAAGFTSVSGSYLKSSYEFGTGLFDTDFSISFWIKVSALPIGVNNQILVRQAGVDIDLQLTTAGNLVWKPSGSFTGATAALGSLNAWHFVVVTYESSPTASISVDGASFTVDSGGGDPPADDDFLYLCSPFGMLLTLNGSIDELACYSAALSDADVDVLYGGGTAPIFR